MNAVVNKIWGHAPPTPLKMCLCSSLKQDDAVNRIEENHNVYMLPWASLNQTMSLSVPYKEFSHRAFARSFWGHIAKLIKIDRNLLWSSDPYLLLYYKSQTIYIRVISVNSTKKGKWPMCSYCISPQTYLLQVPYLINVKLHKSTICARSIITKESKFYIGVFSHTNRVAIKFFPFSNIYDDSSTKTEQRLFKSQMVVS